MTHSAPQRVYAQAKPDNTALERIRRLQRTLLAQSNGRVISPEELHLSLIHFGISEQVYERISDRMRLDRSLFNRELNRYVSETSALLRGESFLSVHSGYAMLGKNATTLVASFEKTAYIVNLHTKLLAVLLGFFERIGLPEPLDFMERDNNFRHAYMVYPHITIYKGYRGSLPVEHLGHVRFTAMPVAYQGGIVATA